MNFDFLHEVPKMTLFSCIFQVMELLLEDKNKLMDQMCLIMEHVSTQTFLKDDGTPNEYAIDRYVRQTCFCLQRTSQIETRQFLIRSILVGFYLK